MIVTLIRHGSTPWNEQGRIQGRRDIPLSDAGRAQVRSWRVPVGPAQWVSSPLRRAVETAELLCGEAPPCASALAEMDWGAWEGCSLAELHELHGAEFARNEALGLDFRPPGGESPRDVLQRLQTWLLQAASGERPVIAVTHRGVLRAMLAAATGWDMTGKPPIRLQSDTCHQFAVAAGGTVALVGCNLPLVA